jgi:hypothetical protein
MSQFIYPPVSATLAGGATETTLQQVEASLAALLAKSPSSPVPQVYDNLEITYVTTGNGVGEIETVLYKVGVSTVRTATLSYDGNNKLSNVIWS